MNIDISDEAEKILNTFGKDLEIQIEVDDEGDVEINLCLFNPTIDSFECIDSMHVLVVKGG